VMVAAAVFAVGGSAVLAAVGGFMQVVEHERRLGDAWRILQAEAGHLRTLPETAPEWTAPSTSSVDAFGLPAATAAATKFSIERTPIDGKPHAGARQLTIVLKWQERVMARTTSLVIHR